MRALTRLVLFLFVLGVLAVAADYAVATVAEQRAAEQATEVLGAPTEVELRGWPRGLQVVTGEVEAVDLRASGVPLQDRVTVDQLDVTLERVEVRWQELFADTERLPPAEAGTFVATLSEDSVRALLAGLGDIVDLRLTAGVIRIGVAGFEAEAGVEARDGAVAIVPEGRLGQFLALEGFRIDLSGQPGAPHVEAVRVEEGQVVLAGALQDVSGSQ